MSGLEKERNKKKKKKKRNSALSEQQGQTEKWDPTGPYKSPDSIFSLGETRDLSLALLSVSSSVSIAVHYAG